jgi:hypothetical protein
VNVTTYTSGTIRGTIQGWRKLSASSGGGGGITQAYQTVQVAGSALPQQSIINFPANMTCVNNAGSSRTDCTPSGGGGTANYAQSFTGQTTVVLTHNLNSVNVLVSCYNASNLQIIPLTQNSARAATITVTDANNVTVTFAIAQTGYCVVNASGSSGGGGGGSIIPFTPPPTSGWLWDNQAGATEVVASNNARAVIQTNNSGGSVVVRYRQLVATSNYTVTMGLSFERSGISNNRILRANAYLRDDSGKLQSFIWQLGDNGTNINGNISALGVDNYNSSTSFSGSVSLSGELNTGALQNMFAYASSVTFFRFVDDGTNVTWSYSRDNIAFVPIFTESRTAFLSSGATGVGFGVLNDENGQYVACSLLSYTETTP